MSKIYRGYKFRIYPTEEQARRIDELIHLTRAVYNWAVAKQNDIYELHEQNLSEYNFYQFNEMCSIYAYERDNNSELHWMGKIPNTTARLAIKNVDTAFKKYFRHITKHPKFKKKNHTKRSFNTRKDSFRIINDRIKIEGIDSTISLNFNSGLIINENRNSKTRAILPTISKDSLGDYYISFSLEEESKDLNTDKSESIGIDLGVNKTFVLDSGEIFNQPKEKLERLEYRRRRIQRHVTRDRKSRLKEAERTKTKYEDIPKSKRAIKRELKMNKIYKKIHDIKNTYYHTITKQLVMRNPKSVCMETFSVKEICRKDKYKNKILHDVNFYDITQKTKYKCNQYNIPFMQVPIGFPSSQICHCCGHKKKMYNYRTYKCPVCGMVEDRDINAAINLRNYGSQFIV